MDKYTKRKERIYRLDQTSDTNWKSLGKGSWQVFINSIQEKFSTNAPQGNARDGLVQRSQGIDIYCPGIRKDLKPKRSP